MTRQEIHSGVRLACQVKIRQNIEIHIPEELLNVKEFRARVSEALDLTYDMRGITFDLIEPAEIDFRPGQYIQILAQGPEEKAAEIQVSQSRSEASRRWWNYVDTEHPNRHNSFGEGRDG